MQRISGLLSYCHVSVHTFLSLFSWPGHSDAVHWTSFCVPSASANLAVSARPPHILMLPSRLSGRRQTDRYFCCLRDIRLNPKTKAAAISTRAHA